MGDLHAVVGASAESALCRAFDAARQSIDGEFYRLGDRAIVGALNRAARRGVSVTVRIEADPKRFDHLTNRERFDAAAQATGARARRELDPDVNLIVEDDPLVELHAKAAVVDAARAFVSTANISPAWHTQDGELLVEDDRPGDARALARSFDGEATASSTRIVAGVASPLRARLDRMLAGSHRVDVAMEDLSDRFVIDRLIARRAARRGDRVIVNLDRRASGHLRGELHRLVNAGVRVRALRGVSMHDKYLDDGSSMYIGSANFTSNGLDDSNEAGIVAPARDFDDRGRAARSAFDRMWNRSQPLTAGDLRK